MAELSQDILTAVELLPERVQPMLDYAEQIDPAAIVVCDRDARPIGQVFEQLAHADGFEAPVFYKHISKRIGVNAAELIAMHCQDVGEVIERADAPARLMVIDDYVSKNAGTMSLFRTAMRRLAVDADIHWVTMAGKGTALNVMPYAGPNAVSPWRDRAEVIGVDYKGIEATPIDTELSHEFASLLGASVRRYLARKPINEAY